MSAYSKSIVNASKKKKPAADDAIITTDDLKDQILPENAAEAQQINPMIIPDFFNNIRNNYYAGNKIIWLTGEIMWENVTEVMKKLSFYDDDTKDPIYIYISSPGGLCDAGWALVDMIEKLKSKKIEVNTICAGSCSSMASVILAAGTKGHRYAFPSSRIMIHQAGIGFMSGKFDEMANEVKELQYWTDLTAKYFAKVTNKNAQEVQKALRYDNYMSVQEAKKFGIIDKVDVVFA